jgi:hypothetical protein
MNLFHNGQVYLAPIGAIDSDATDGDRNADIKYLEKAIQYTLSGGAVEIQRTKPSGCGIKYKDEMTESPLRH